MRADQVNEVAKKQADKLFNKYSKIFLKQIRKKIKEAAKKGKTVTSVIIREPEISDKVLNNIHQYICLTLSADGFYVRKYGLGGYMPREDYRISWGAGISEQRRIDENTEKWIADERAAVAKEEK